MTRQLAIIRDKIAIEEGSNSAALGRLQQWADISKFNVKACYEFYRAKGSKLCWAKMVWHRSLMPKHSFMLWLSINERLLTRDKTK